jgi:hypothetical protein
MHPSPLSSSKPLSSAKGNPATHINFFLLPGPGNHLLASVSVFTDLVLIYLRLSVHLPVWSFPVLKAQLKLLLFQ